MTMTNNPDRRHPLAHATGLGHRLFAGARRQLAHGVAIAEGALQGTSSPATWAAELLAFSINGWAALLGCPEKTYALRIDLDRRAEMAGPVFWAVPPSVQTVTQTDLVRDGGGATIPRDHLVVRVHGGELAICLVNLAELQKTLPAGLYRATLGAGAQSLPFTVRRLP